MIGMEIPYYVLGKLTEETVYPTITSRAFIVNHEVIVQAPSWAVDGNRWDYAGHGVYHVVCKHQDTYARLGGRGEELLACRDCNFYFIRPRDRLCFPPPPMGFTWDDRDQ